MRIKKIEIQGFKSFCDRTVLDLQGGITTVVGPNGCGKSNIIDAIRWSMGEQSAKNLRGRAMEDVIFGGSENRKQMGMAEVSLHFVNNQGKFPPAFRDFDEISVTRRLFRNGDSEYLLNKIPVRLRDISELFMDTGVGARTYAIIEQGKIGMILHAKPEERRSLIEEAAGVTKFKARKKMALRKIDATRVNLTRLSDIIAEVRRQLGRLKRAAQKAEEFKAHRDELRLIETHFAIEQQRSLQEQLQQKEKDELALRAELELTEGKLVDTELQVEERRLLQIEEEKRVNEGQEKVFTLSSRIQQVEGQIDLNRKELHNLEQLSERQQTEISEIEETITRLTEEEKGLKESLLTVTEDQEKKGRLLIESEIILEELTSNEQDLSEQLEEVRRALYAAMNELSRIGSHYEESGRRLEDVTDKLDRRGRETVTLNEGFMEAQSQQNSLQASVDQIMSERDEYATKLETLQEELLSIASKLQTDDEKSQQLREGLSGRISRLESFRELESQFAGFESGVKSLLSDDSFRSRVRGILADQLNVPVELEQAVEAIAGARLQSPLVGEKSDIDEAFRLLEGKGGRCTLVLGGAKSFGAPLFHKGKALIDMLDMPDTAEESAIDENLSAAGLPSVVESLFGGVFLVDEIMSFVGQELPFGVVLVTTRGEILTWRGEITGGSRTELDEGLLARKRQILELETTIANEQQELASLDQDRADTRARQHLLQEQQLELQQLVRSAELKIIEGEKELTKVQSEVDRFRERLEILELEGEQLYEERDSLDAQRKKAQDDRARCEGERAQHEEELARLNEVLEMSRRDVATVRDRVTSLKIDVASIREREESGRNSLIRIERMLVEQRARSVVLVGRQSEGGQDNVRLNLEIERMKESLVGIFAERDDARESFEKLREAYEEGIRCITEYEGLLKGLRQDVAAKRESLSHLQMKVRELSLELDHIYRTFHSRYQVDLAEEAARLDGPFDVQAGERRLHQLTQLIGDMGEVNLTAIDEYRELDERYSFLTGQQEDLRESLDDLNKAISKINRVTRKRFKEAFEQVNAKFQEVFPRLFRGGKAELILTDEEDVLESGIDIVAQPPGKKLQNVGLLSGGEKALTAVALVFSIFLIKPSPFCILDEVDAPLDDANIGRFNEMVREMSIESQFMIITHNKMTMEIGDSMFGVTMEIPGVSKMVSVRISG